MRQASEQNSFCFLCGACSTGFPHCLHRGVSSPSAQTNGCLRQYDLTVFCGNLVICAISLYPYPWRCRRTISSISFCTMPYSYLGTNASFSIYGHRNDRIGRYESKKTRETAFKPFRGNLMAFLFIYRIFNQPSTDQSNAPPCR